MGHINTHNKQKNDKLIFIIDDCCLQKLLLEKTLQNNGYEVRGFTNGFKLIEALESECPDLIISDIDMPKINGLDLIREIKMRQHCDKIPFWFLSSFNISDLKEEAENLGAEKFINKPFNDENLLSHVEDRFERMPDVA